MRIPLALFFSLILGIAKAQKENTDHRLTGLDTAFTRVLKDWHGVGFAIAVVEKNKLIYEKGFGYKDLESKSPVTPNTLFAIGSCTKAFTASLLGILRQEGKVDLDKPVANYYPELKFYNDEMNNKVTLRDMMSHRTGLPRHDYSWYFFMPRSRDSLIMRIQYLEPSAGLREKWQYNNFMFMAQGALVEKLTNKSWEENVREKIFTPLGMTNSDFSIEDLIKNSDHATGYGLKHDSVIDKQPHYHIDAMGPAGSINSSVHEMSNWVLTWINGGKFMDKEILPPSYVKEAMSSQMVISGALPEDFKDIFFANYGLGWGMVSYRGHYRVEHGGNIDGFSASTSFFPADSVGIIVLANQDGSAIPSIIRNLVADRMLGLKYVDWETNQKKAADKRRASAKEAEKNVVSNRKPETKPSLPLDQYTGFYINKGYGILNVELIHDSLFASSSIRSWWLRHYHFDSFEPFMKDGSGKYDTTDKGSPLEFFLGTAGEVESLKIGLEPSVKPIEFIKTPKPKELGKKELEKYTGDYDFSGVVAKVSFKNDKTLVLNVPGQPEYELVPIDNNKFNIKSLSGFTIQFNLNDKNEVVELMSIQPNGTFKAPKKK